MATSVGLIDYGMGNLFSVQKAFGRLGKSLILIKRPNDLINCDSLILPGVGSFDPAMDQLKSTKLIPYIRNWVKEEKPLLGICLGLQLLFESSDEGRLEGLGLIQGNVQKLPNDQSERVPHMGWALLRSQKPCPLIRKDETPKWVYFVHSYEAKPSCSSDLAATVSFGSSDLTAIVWKNRLGACQFHPEKSAKTGQKMLRNWLEWIESGAQI